MSLPQLEHHHITYQSVSVVSAVVCPVCGLFVGGDFTAEHNRFHDQLAALLQQPKPKARVRKPKPEITEHAHANGD